ncbi:hypothetical protein C900_01216 [Fulvivirga imtechensis AK7]|uniref:DUF998 domain-containing protein n=1 Tax=Fulvivirga imtechensis AK7 TaxID=1237149 RepID=L8JKU1_9BACT|nr:hypothetical protein [Fulvivirga imtechensis]ELR68042.1 hypothetical protein C900_01216 [Fulvivirga imtechensis AK7]
MRLVKLLGIGVTIAYLLSFATIFVMNPQTFEEVEFLGITSFNLDGFKNQIQAEVFNYFLVGLLIIVFGVLLSIESKTNNLGRIGSYFISFSGLMWMSFSFFSLNPSSTEVVFGITHMIRIGLCWISGIVGLILVSVDFRKYYQLEVIKWITLAVAILMLLEPVYYVINDYSGMISLIAWTIYMSWFFVFSIFIKSKVQT